MDVSLFIRQRLEEFGLEQRELAQAAQVTESYISQLLTRKKTPPAPSKTDIYEKMDKFLRLPNGELARLAALERAEKGRKPPSSLPMFPATRELVLGKCDADQRRDVRAIFERQPFGELERLVIGQLLEVASEAARNRRGSDAGTRSAECFQLSSDACVSLLESIIERWRVDLATFAVDIVMASTAEAKRFEFMERDVPHPGSDEAPGFRDFLANHALSADATKEELDFLRGLQLGALRPTALYYHRQLQALRDPENFRAARTPR